MLKGIAIPYVIALILGVVVIGLLGVWLVMSGGKFTKATLENDCRIAMTKACTQAISKGADGGPISYPSTECGSLRFPSSATLTDCKAQLGVS